MDSITAAAAIESSKEIVKSVRHVALSEVADEQQPVEASDVVAASTQPTAEELDSSTANKAQSAAELLEFEVVPDDDVQAPHPMRGTDRVDFDSMDIKTIEKQIVLRWNKSKGLSKAAVNLSHQHLSNCWAIGKMSEVAKEILPKGRFGPWRTRKVERACGISRRHAQRFAEMARQFKTLPELLNAAPNLQRAFESLGMVPVEASSESIEAKKDKVVATPATKYVDALTDAQYALEDAVQAKEDLLEEVSDNDLVNIEAAIKKVLNLVSVIRGDVADDYQDE